jgi:hypothetical protein
MKRNERRFDAAAVRQTQGYVRRSRVVVSRFFPLQLLLQQISGDQSDLTDKKVNLSVPNFLVCD